MELIEAKTLTTTTASFTFSAIPATYTDLCIVVSARSDTAATQDGLWISQINGSGSNLSNIWLRGSGSSTTSSTSALYGILVGQINAANSTANTFSNLSIYIPNYASANNKSISIDSVQEHNATEAYMGFTAGLWSNSAAITSITLDPQVGDLVQHSTAYLYGISNVTSTAKATGGIVSSDATYWYHMFPYSSTFTPTAAISADVLCIAGGGAGGYGDNNNWENGGGGAGGLQLFSSQALTATGYTVTVGAGGTSTNTTSVNGNNSQFASLTASVGGGAGGTTNGVGSSHGGNNGGSGGGGSRVIQTAGTGTSGQGNNGASYGGGGGAGAAATGFPGGAGTNTYSTWASATETGVSGYYAGGGGGNGGAGGAGGAGGGGAAVYQISVPGTANTGGGGGANAYGQSGGSPGANGGSGLVIIRYAK